MADTSDISITMMSLILKYDNEVRDPNAPLDASLTTIGLNEFALDASLTTIGFNLLARWTHL